MQEFRFGNNNLKLALNGASFEVDPATIEVAVEAAQKIILDFNTKMNAGEATKEHIEDTISGLIEKVDEGLGKGAIDRIFKNRTVISLHDMCDVVIYIKGCCAEFEDRKAGFYDNYKKPAQNREQRRQNVKRLKG